VYRNEHTAMNASGMRQTATESQFCVLGINGSEYEKNWVDLN
jgi:hypothetical protein